MMKKWGLILAASVMTITAWCKTIDAPTERAWIVEMRQEDLDKRFQRKFKAIQRNIINSIRRLDPIIIEWQINSNYLWARPDNLVWIEIRNPLLSIAKDEKAVARYNPCYNSVVFRFNRESLKGKVNIQRFSSHEIFHSIYDQLDSCPGVWVERRSILNQIEYDWPTLGDIEEFALNRMNRSSYRRYKAFVKRKIARWGRSASAASEAKEYRMKYKYFFKDPDEIVAIMIWSLYALNLSKDMADFHLLNRKDLEFLEKFSYKGVKMFRIWIEKYRLWLKMKKSWVSERRIRRRLLDAEHYRDPYTWKTYNWPRADFDVKWSFPVVSYEN